MEKTKPHLLRAKSEAELLTQLEQLKNELTQLRVAGIAGNAAAKLAKIRFVHRSIACVLTIYNSKVRAAAKEHYKTKRLKPLEFRVKKTRAIRRALTKRQQSKKTLKERKRQENLPLRKFALLSSA